ncbi:MAG: hypothetical protein K1Y02_22310 [Candidatus Hydrogenedentes bacterium]|nr:hypothetical protein [Candidatus Hydrogenedentota bacterium]
MDVEVQSAQVPPPARRRVFTFEPGGPTWWYVMRMGLVAVLGALVVAVPVQLLLQSDDPRAEMLESHFLVAAFAMIVVAPLLETLLMALFFGIATFFSKNLHRLALVSALCWGVLHVFNSPTNAIAVLWPFYIMSRVYLAWRRIGLWKAMGVTALVHALINALALVMAGLFAALGEAPPSDLTSPPTLQQYAPVDQSQHQYLP